MCPAAGPADYKKSSTNGQVAAFTYADQDVPVGMDGVKNWIAIGSAYVLTVAEV